MSTVEQHTYFIYLYMICHSWLLWCKFDSTCRAKEALAQAKPTRTAEAATFDCHDSSIPLWPGTTIQYNQNHGSKHASKIHWIPMQGKQDRNVTCDATAQPDSKKSQGKTCRNDGKVWLQRDAKRFLFAALQHVEFESKSAKAIRINFTVHIDPPIKPCRKRLLPSYTKGPQMHCLSTATCWQVFWISLSFTSQLFGDAPPWPLQVES